MALRIITPPVAETPLDDMLVELTRLISLNNPGLVASGCLGGEFGYGAVYENVVFVMRPYYWGDCDCGYLHESTIWDKNHKHSRNCYLSLYMAKVGERSLDFVYRRSVAKDLCDSFGIPWNDGLGSAAHCTCDYGVDWKVFLGEHNGHKSSCSLELPNFLHKRIGFEVRWYKWIGRDMKMLNQPTDLTPVFKECRESMEVGR